MTIVKTPATVLGPCGALGLVACATPQGRHRAPTGHQWIPNRKMMGDTLKGPAEIDIQGRQVSAVESVLIIEGIPEFLLRSRLWQRRSDGRSLRPFVPPFGGMGASTLIELAGESGRLTE